MKSFPFIRRRLLSILCASSLGAFAVGCDAGLSEDAGFVDAGSTDGGRVLDAGDLDGGALDGGGVVDGGDVDGGLVDSGLLDGGVVDGGLVDGGDVDGGVVDSGLLDGGRVDGGLGDGGPDDGGASDGGGVDAGPVDAGPTNPLLEPYVVEELDGTFSFVEGPVWRPASSDLLFCDIPVRTIFRRTGDGSISPFATNIDCNGLVLDGTEVVVAGYIGHDLKRVSSDGSGVVNLPLFFEGARLNSPNDLVFRSDGTLFLTDPAFGVNGGDRDITFNGVFRINDTTLVDEDRYTTGERPNGIALSPDEATAYVSDSNATSVYAYAVASDGSFGPRQTFASVSSGGDGLAVDVVGNLYVTTGAGIEVIAPTGENLGTILVPSQPANCTFGDDDLRTLYITARTKLYSVRLPIPGQPPAR